MKPTPNNISQYHVFLASPGDVGVERQAVRKFFDDYNRSTAHIWNARFDVVDWENYSTIGVGRPQELINQQTLDKYRDSLALVIGIMAQRFGSPSGKEESGTVEEFNWAMDSHQAKGFPEIKWFFRKVDKLDGLPADPVEAIKALEQWQKVLAFRKRMQDLKNPVFYAEYPSPAGFAEMLGRDLNHWLADPSRPWAEQRAAHLASSGTASAPALAIGFDLEGYRLAVLKRYDKLNFEMLDTTGASYNAVRLWSVFVAQSVRECHQYNPRLLEIPKEHQRRLLEAGEISEKELAEAEKQADQLRQQYFQQPLRSMLEVVDETLRSATAGTARKLVILGDPGSGKSSLIRYLAVRWAGITDPAVRDTQPVPLVVELGAYGRWQCDGRKDFLRFLEEAPGWHSWAAGRLAKLLAQPGRVVLLLDGLDEVFDVLLRAEVMDDIQRFSSQFPHLPILVTSRVVGYQAQRLRDAEFRHFMLQDLAPAQITDFLQRWHEVTFDDPALAAPKRDRLQKAVRDAKSMALLAGNPLLLTMMAILNRNQELPRDRADLYAQASRVLLHQWDTERALENFPGISNEIGLREKADLLRRIAADMQAAPGGLKGNLINGPTLTRLIEDYLQNELHITQSHTLARSVLEQLRLRNFILCFVGTDSYAFVHRIFLEYFCAADIVHQFNVAKTLDIEGLIALFDQHCREEEWREVLLLICGQINEQFVGRIVEHLSTRTDLENWEGTTRLPELPLAIDCLNQVRNLSALDGAGRTLGESLLKIYTSGKGSEDFHRQILASSRDLGPRWPGAETLYESVRNDDLQLDATNWRLEYLVRLLASVRLDQSTIYRFVTSANSRMRRGAIEALVESTPDETTRALLTKYAAQDLDGDIRRFSLEALVEKWPEQTTRDLLVQRAVQDANYGPRSTALKALAERWPDQTTRDLLAQCAVQDDNYGPRSTALKALAENWPDQTTRDLLAQRAFLDDNDAPRLTCLQTLADRWPDETTRDLLIQNVVQNRDAAVNGAVLRALADRWPDITTRGLLESTLQTSADHSVRETALVLLLANWPDTRTVAVCREIAKDEDPLVRITVLRQLASGFWEDSSVRQFVREKAHSDIDQAVRENVGGIPGKLSSRLVGRWEDYLRGATDRNDLPAMPHGFPAIQIKSFRLRNIRMFEDTDKVDLSTTTTLLLGTNATGKSTILRCLALASVGSTAAYGVEQDAASYLRNGAKTGSIEVLYSLIPEPDALPAEYGQFSVGLAIHSNTDRFVPLPNSEMTLGPMNCIQRLDLLRSEIALAFGFICAYGATRSFSNSRFGVEVEKELPKEENEWVVSLFRSDAGLVNPQVLSRLVRGDTRNISGAPAALSEGLAKSLCKRIEAMLPRVEMLHPDGTRDLRLNGTDLWFGDLSDGYRSILAVIGHFVRSALKLSKWTTPPTDVHGIILIDEVDLHLHPAWQRHVLNDLRQAFPNIQWITTSHSPIIAGSVESGSLRLLKNADSRSTILEDLPSISGWFIDHVLTSVLFDLPTTRDVKTEQLITKYAHLLNESGPEDEEVEKLEAELARRDRRRRCDARVDEGAWDLVLEATRSRLMKVSEQQRTRILAELRLALHS